MIRIEIKRRGVRLSKIAEEQMPFAVSKAINATLEQIQTAQRAGQRQRFNVAAGRFVDFLVKINRGDFATKRKLVGRVGIQGNRAEILTKFEAGGQKVSIKGRPYIALPSREIKRTKRGKVAPSNRLSAFKPFSLASSLTRIRLMGRTRTPDRRPYDVGQKNTFFIRLTKGRLAGFPALMQGLKRGKAKLLYLFVPSVRIPPALEFAETSRAVVRSGWASNLTTALRRALATARPR